jgi:hypothetical protein
MVSIMAHSPEWPILKGAADVVGLGLPWSYCRGTVVSQKVVSIGSASLSITQL